MSSLLRKLSDVHKADSFSNRLRARRFARFADSIARMPKPVRILDVGGTTSFWRQRGWLDREGVVITILNAQPEEERGSNYETVAGDATDLGSFSVGDFDVAFSNSVIEHLFDWEHQQAMASEVRRIAPAYWVQTPNYWFPIEPHFLWPGWQWMPERARIALIRRRRCGWRGPCPDPVAAAELVREVKLLTRGDMRRLFPDAKLHAERFCGLAKSWIAVRGLDVRSAVDPSPASSIS